jgi:hypothetical protein
MDQNEEAEEIVRRLQGQFRQEYIAEYSYYSVNIGSDGRVELVLKQDVNVR